MKLRLISLCNSKTHLSIYAALLLFLGMFFWTNVTLAQKTANKKQREYMAIRVYHAADSMQLTTINHYLETSFVPALTSGGFKKIGVFAAAANDTASDKKLYVFVPFQSLQQLEQIGMTA
ncbi:MAG TPA: hypothetical protein VM871_08835, partial [Flavisolibacter sp.]|nr:hypothetical protein [Flavisolibacter sp.]